MSDFLFSNRRCEPGVLRSALERYLGAVTEELTEHHGSWGSLAVARAPHDPPLVVSEGDSLTLLVGEPVVRIAPAAPAMARERSPREALHRHVAREPAPAWDEILDGPFALLRVDTVRGTGFLVTDLLSSIPVFHAVGGEQVVVGTHADAVAVAAGRGGDLDPASAADLLMNLSITFPYTLYPGVEQLTPASVHPFSPAGWDGQRPYWRPVEEELHPTLAAAAEALREALVESVRAACMGEAEVGLLLSAGEDSRAVLGAVPPSTRVRGFVFADRENREVAIARRVARAYGAEVVLGARSPTHYLEHFDAVARMVGSIQLFVDVHGYGFHHALGIAEMPVVLGGFSADSLLKGDYVPKRDPRAGGADWGDAPLPMTPLPGIRRELVEEVRSRRRAHRARIGEMRPRSAAEWYRLWPFTMRKHAGNLHGNRRLFHTHEPFHANAVVKLAAGVPQEWKSGRRLFHAAVRPLLARSWHVTHSKPRMPYFSGRANLFLGVGIGAARGVRALLTGSIRANEGPWPKWKRLVASEAMARLADEHDLARSTLSEVFDLASPEEQGRRMREEWVPFRRLLAIQLAHLAKVGEGAGARSR